MSDYDDLGTCRTCGNRVWEINGRPVHNVTNYLTTCKEARV
jgi:hypothetical protein